MTDDGVPHGGGWTTAPDDDPYAILGVSRQASDATIAAAYRDLARRHHPDIAGEDATASMMRINAAFDAIKTAKRRLEFGAMDSWTAGPPAPATTGGAGGVGGTGTGSPSGGAGVDPARRSASATPGSGAGQPSPGRPRTDPDVHDRERLQWRPEHDGTGGAGPPPGRPSGTVLQFGRHVGWSIGEIARVDPGYLEWLSQRREGAPYVKEIEGALARVGFRGRSL